MNKNIQYGLYYYTDSERDDEIVYIGRTKFMKNKIRDKQHRTRKNSSIPFDRILQNNPNRFKYNVLCYCETEEDSIELEEIWVNDIYKPRFNFQNGGNGNREYKQRDEFTIRKDGKNGWCIYNYYKVIKSSKDKSKLIKLCEKLNNKTMTIEEVKKYNLNPFEYSILSVKKESRKVYYINSKNNNHLITTIYKSELIPIVEGLKNGELSEEDVKNIDLRYERYSKYYIRKHDIIKSGKQQYELINPKREVIKYSVDKEKLIFLSNKLNNGEITEDEVKNSNLGTQYWNTEDKKKLASERNKSGIMNVMKVKTNNKKGFSWRYAYMVKNKRKMIQLTDLTKLEEKVKSKGLDWIIIDEILAKKSYQENML